MNERWRQVLAGQLRRPPRGVVGVAATCPFGLPAVIENAAYFEDGEPCPTLYYLTCPTAAAEVSRLEGAGGVRRFRRLVETDVVFKDRLETLAGEYRRRRGARGAPPAAIDGGAVLTRGVGGAIELESASCLHAWAAALLVFMEEGSQAGADGTAETPEPAPAGAASEARTVWGRIFPAVAELWCGDERCRRFLPDDAPSATHPRARRAVIDVGTTSVRLLVAEVVGGSIRDLARKATVTRLGEDLTPGGSLSVEARARTRDVVALYRGDVEDLGAESLVVLATSALRDAADGRSFLDEMVAPGDVVALLRGEQEALLGYCGASLDVGGEFILVDIGGGSTELVRAVGSSVTGMGVGGASGATVGTPSAVPFGAALPSVTAVSLELGASRHSGRHIHHDPPLPEEREAVRAAARRLVAPHREVFGSAGGASNLVGVAGTVVTLACLALDLDSYQRDRVHLSVITRDALAAQVDRLASLPAMARRSLPCMQAGRETVIVGGGDILITTLDTLGFDRLTVSERDLLDGAALLGPQGIRALQT